MKIKKIISLLLLCFMIIPSFVLGGFYKTEQIMNMGFDEDLRAFRQAGTLSNGTTNYGITVSTSSVYEINIPTTSIYYHFQNVSTNSDSLFFSETSSTTLTTNGTEIEPGRTWNYKEEYNGPVYLQGIEGGSDLDIRIKGFTK